MNSDVALAERTENRIGNSMRECVGVGMTFGPTIGSDMHTTKDQLPPLN
jgi:hypothetical protein